MTDKEKAVVMAYTGIGMLAGDKFQIFHKYIEEICGRPIWTHQLAVKAVWDEIKEKSKPDFIALCKETTETEPIRHGRWIKVSDKAPKYCCTECDHLYNNKEYKRCPFCGAKMDGKENEE